MLNPQLEKHLLENVHVVKATKESEKANVHERLRPTGRYLFSSDGPISALRQIQLACSIAWVMSILVEAFWIALAIKIDIDQKFLSQFFSKGFGILASVVGNPSSIACFLAGVLVTLSIQSFWMRLVLNWPIDTKCTQVSGRQSVLHLQESRKQISALLGSIGAPPLQFSSPPMKASTMSLTDLKEYLDLVTRFTIVHVDLVQSLVNAIEILRLGASIQLGVSKSGNLGRFVNVGRIEKTAMTRWIRSKQQARVDTELTDTIRESFPLAMPVLRERIYQILWKHIECLKTAKETTNLNRTESQNVGFQKNRYDDSNVVTIALLSSMKSTLIESLTQVLHSAACRSEFAIEITRAQLEHCTNEAKCSVDYTTSSLNSFSRSTPSSALHSDTLEHLMYLGYQVERLLVAIVAHQENTIHKSSLSSVGKNENVDLELWGEIRSLTDDIHSVVDNIDESNREASFNIGQSSTNVKNDHCQKIDKVPCSEIFDVGDTDCFNNIHLRAKEKPESVTLVFSGVSELRKRQRSFGPSVSDRFSDEPVDLHRELFAELNDRLALMPQVQERDIQMSEIHVQSEMETVSDFPRGSDRTKSAISDTTLLTSMIDSEIFLGELTTSILARQQAFSSAAGENRSIHCFEGNIAISESTEESYS